MALHALYFGVSVQGPWHLSRHLPNEDAWLGARGRFGAIAAVSDGMGSRPQSRRGARAACKAVLKAVRQWHHDEPGGDIGLVELVSRVWHEDIAPCTAHDCAATCLIALMRPAGELIAAGVGDGMIIVKLPGEPVQWLVGPRAAGFGDETDSLGMDPSWRIRRLDCSGGATVVLATDGIADDLLPERIDGFVDWLVEDYAGMAPRSRWRALGRELRAWPTPQHLDDKTLVVIHARTGGPVR